VVLKVINNVDVARVRVLLRYMRPCNVAQVKGTQEERRQEREI